jgi:hypothetical protein
MSIENTLEGRIEKSDNPFLSKPAAASYFSISFECISLREMTCSVMDLIAFFFLARNIIFLSSLLGSAFYFPIR